MNKPRIAHFVTSFETGGIQSFVENLSTGLKNEYEIEICSLYGKKPGFESKDGLRYRSFGASRSNLPIAIAKINRYLIQEKVAILHAHPGTITRLSGILAKVPILLATVHGSWPQRNPLSLRLHQFLAQHTNLTIANSNFTRGYYTSLLNVDENRLTTIYNGINTECFYPASLDERFRSREELRFSADSIVIAASGRFHPDKGFDVLVKSFSQLAGQISNLHLCLIGDGPCRESLERLVRENGLASRVRFTGFMTDLRPAMACADIFVLPSSRREGFGLSLAEAMAMELPTIGTKIGGVPEIIIDGYNGLLAFPGDPVSLSQSILHYLRSNECMQELGKRGRETVKMRFSLEKMLVEYRGVYENELEQAKFAPQRG